MCHSQSHYLFFVIWFADILFNYLHNFHISDYARSFKFFLLLSKQFFFYLLYIRYFFCRYSFFWPKEQYSFNVKCTYCRFNFCWLPQIPHAMKVRLAFWILILVSPTSTTLPKYLCGSNVWSEVYLWRLKYNFFHMLTLCLSTIICLIYHNYLCLSTIIFHLYVAISYVLMQWWPVWFHVLPSGVRHGIFCMWTNRFSFWPTGSLCKIWGIMSVRHPKYAVAYRRMRMIDVSSYKNHWFAQLPTHSGVLYFLIYTSTEPRP